MTLHRVTAIFSSRRIVYLTLALVMVACGQSPKAAPTTTAIAPFQAAITAQPTATTGHAPSLALPTVISTNVPSTVLAQCPASWSGDSYPTPAPADRMGWCQIENGNVRFMYPNSWVVGLMGAAGQNRQFGVQMSPGEKQIVRVVYSMTDLQIDQADQATDGGYELTAPAPFVDPHEIMKFRSFQTLGGRTILALVTQLQSVWIKRYFLVDQKTLLIIRTDVPIAGFDSPEFNALFRTLEEVISTVQVMGLPAKG